MAEQQKPTPYVVLVKMTDGWSVAGRGDGRKGEEAIKAVAKTSTGSEGDSYKGGQWKAIPASTWESEGNNLTIVSETKVVTSFIRPKRSSNGTPAAKPKAKAAK